MVSGQKYYMDEETRLKNRIPVRKACLCLHAPSVSQLIDTPLSTFTPPSASMLIPQLSAHKSLLQRGKGTATACVNWS